VGGAAVRPRAVADADDLPGHTVLWLSVEAAEGHRFEASMTSGARHNGKTIKPGTAFAFDGRRVNGIEPIPWTPASAAGKPSPWYAVRLDHPALLGG
jgi:hypothetical protein